MRHIRIALLCWLLCYSVVIADDLTIKESTDHGIIIEFNPENWDVREENIKDKSYFLIRFSGDNIITKPGQPMVPCRTTMIGIPLEARLEYQIIEVVTGRKLYGKLIPTPTLPAQEYSEDQTYYTRSNQFPAKMIQAEKPGFIRNQRVVCINLFPVQYIPQKNEIQLINKIVLQVKFIGVKVNQNPLKDEQDDFFYQNTILNYDQAKQWRKHTSRNLVQKSNISFSETWYKIFIKKEGIYKITGKLLADNGIQINLIDPATIRIYNNGGKELPREIYAPRPDSLIENTVLVVDNDDGILNESDYILFYGKSIQGWDYDTDKKTFSHYINHYTNNNVYWLTWGSNQISKRMASVTLPMNEQLPLKTSFWDHVFLEEDYYNPLESGIDWYGKAFSNTGSSTDNKTITFNLRGARSQDPTELKIKLAGISAGEHRFQFFMNEHYLGETKFYSYSSKYVNVTQSLFSKTAPNILIDGYNELRLQYSLYLTSSVAYLDWIELNFWRNLVADENELLFYSPSELGAYRFQLSNFLKDDVYLFDITDYADVRQFNNLQISNGTITFVDTVNSELSKRYLALVEEKFLTPISIEKDITSDLRATTHDADFIIITHDNFYDAARRLADHRESHDNLKTKVVKISDIYDEFSWGLFDPIAIRDFIKYAYENWSVQPSYVLLFGSGDYDYRNIHDPVDHNLIPPFETTELYEGDNRAWDDWYVCVSGDDKYIDLSIGRLPVRTTDHANNVVDKIIDYDSHPLYGDWRNTITMVADDLTGEDKNFIEREHTIEAENISEYNLPNSFNINKIYLIDYPGIFTASITGTRKPAAQQDVVEAINRGCLIINYIGHGRYDLWAHELVLTMDQDLPKINNGQKQAFWIAGTCYFGRFDNPNYESMTEELIILKDNGAIGVLASARLVSSGPNIAFNKLLYEKLFPSAYHRVRIGDAVSDTKNSRGNYENDQKILLFCDPTLFLANPVCKAKITSIIPDTIKALSHFKVSGEVQKDGFRWSDFNGTALLKAFDSNKYRTYVIAENDVINYRLSGNTIFRGTGKVINGEFNFEFIVPKDITYGGQSGRLGVYFWDNQVDGTGFRESLPVGGTETNIFDNKGPQIIIRFDDKEFFSGGFTNENPVLNIDITDSLSGINIAGDIGHNILLSLDEEKTNITDLFNYYDNNYIAGSIDYPLRALNDGIHNLVVKAWDNSNNSSEISIEFTVIIHDRLVLSDLLNYPNPFSSSTDFTFKASQDCHATIKIYTVAGRLIKKIEGVYANNGFNHVFWDGRDEDGNPIANGVYLYKISARSQYEGKTLSSEAIEKLMIVR